MIVFVCSLIGFILFIFGSTWYAATTRGGTGFICYQEPNTCFNTDDALLQISVKHCPRSSYCYCFMFFQLHKLS